MSARARQGGPVGSATLWMVVLSLLLFWLTTLGFGRRVGRRKEGRRSRTCIGRFRDPRGGRLRPDLSGRRPIRPARHRGLVATGVLVVILIQSLPLLVGAIGGGSLSASLGLYGRRADFDSPKG